MTFVCRRCHTENKEQDNFCTKCGGNLKLFGNTTEGDYEEYLKTGRSKNIFDDSKLLEDWVRDTRQWNNETYWKMVEERENERGRRMKLSKLATKEQSIEINEPAILVRFIETVTGQGYRLLVPEEYLS